MNQVRQVFRMFKDLVRRVASDLQDEAVDTVSNPKYDSYQRDPVSIN